MSEGHSAASAGPKPVSSLSGPGHTPAPDRRIPFEFRATGGEYFRIWIVNLLLTIVTLGIYSAWAKVRRLRYFYGNTRLDRTALDYHGKPLQILKGRLIAFGAYAVFYVAAQIKPWAAIAFLPLATFGVPWIIMKSRRFQMHMTSYRGLRFRFTGSYGEALGAYVGWPLLGALTLGILFPRAIWEQVNYLLSKSHYGTEQARFTTARGVFYRFYYVTMGLGVVLAATAMGIFAALAATADSEGEPSLGALTTTGGIALFIAIVVLYMLLAAYYRKSYLNASFNGLELGPHRVESSLQAGPLFVLYLANFLLIVLTLGLYSPWAKVRQMQYQLESLRVVARGDLDQFVAAAGEGVDAIGEEVGDFFDLDFGL